MLQCGNVATGRNGLQADGAGRLGGAVADTEGWKVGAGKVRAGGLDGVARGEDEPGDSGEIGGEAGGNNFDQGRKDRPPALGEVGGEGAGLGFGAGDEDGLQTGGSVRGGCGGVLPVLPAGAVLSNRERVLGPGLPADPICLGIESSCDDTAAALVRGDGEILASVVMGQGALHADFGGVVPEIAARAHAERIDLCIEEALEAAGCSLQEVGLVAATSGPGLIGGVLAGMMSAKALSVALDVPFLGVNHLAGHALTPRLTDGLGFPYLMLLVSGGHCQFLSVLGPDRFERLGGTIDDAPGEAFDKVAKMLGLGYPGGPEVEREALASDAGRFGFPRPLLDRDDCNLSFSGLKTAVRRARDELVTAQGGLTRRDRADLCAGFQAAVAEVLAAKTARACAEFSAAHGAGVIAVAGGVAANAAIREALEAVASEAGFRFTAPPLNLCTDNAAMIAWAGLERLRLGLTDPLTFAPRPRWPLDSLTAAA